MDSFTKGRLEQVNPEYYQAVCQCEELPLSGRLLAKSYHDLTQGLDGLHQLYRSCCWNYRKLMSGVDISDDDQINKCASKGNSKEMGELYFDVNCYVANFISSGMCLVEALRTFAKEDLYEGEDSAGFNKFVNDLYDSNARYRFVSELRNYVQHGQLVVSIYRSESSYKACFDINQLIKPCHFTIKRSYRDLLQDISVQLDDVRATFERIAIKPMLLDYYASVQTIYDHFLLTCAAKLPARCDSFYRVIDDHPECVATYDLVGQMVRYVDGDEMHVLNGIDVRLSDTLGARRAEMQPELCRAKKENEALQSKYVSL